MKPPVPPQGTIKHMQQYTNAAILEKVDGVTHTSPVALSDDDFSDDELCFDVQNEKQCSNGIEGILPKPFEKPATDPPVHTSNNDDLMETAQSESDPRPEQLQKHDIVVQDPVQESVLEQPGVKKVAATSGPIMNASEVCSTFNLTSQLHVARDSDFDESVQHDIAVLKQLWAEEDNNKEQGFTPVISKSQKKRNRLKAAGQPYQTCSKGAPSTKSL
jgi:hypothetical protein